MSENSRTAGGAGARHDVIVAIEALAGDDFQHCDIVAVRALLLCRLGCVRDPIGAFAGVGDPS
ncbi:MAG: hypothetical protein ACXVHB_28990 [Solirubrobacteraceae bacterium]